MAAKADIGRKTSRRPPTKPSTIDDELTEGSSLKERLFWIFRTRLHRIALIVIALVAFYWMYPEIVFSSIYYNDGVSHISIVRGMDGAWQNGGNITDFWMDNINFGHALLRSYQFLLHLIVWVLHATVLSSMPIEKCFNTCIVVMAMVLPVAFYKGSRLLGLGRLESVIAATGIVLVHERDGYGVGLTNYTYSGYGLYNQLLATSFFMLTIGFARKMVRTGRGVLATSILFALTFMSHIMTGYMACVWIALDALFATAFEREGEALRAWLRKLGLTLAKFGGLVLLWTGHWVIPMARDGLYQRHTSYDMAAKFLGHGAEKVVTDLWSGNVMDADRHIPVQTILGTLGLLLCLASWIPRRAAGGKAKKTSPVIMLNSTRSSIDERAVVARSMRRELAVQTILWILISFGPATWGSLTSILPFSGQLHWHRFIAGVEITMILCAAICLGALWRWLTASGAKLNRFAGATLFIALLFPCVAERQSFFYSTNTFWLIDTHEAWESNQNNYHTALDFMMTHPHSRYYFGDPVKEHAWADLLKVSRTIPWYGLAVQFNVSDVGSIHNHQNHTETLAYNLEWNNPNALELTNVGYVGVPTSHPVPQNWTKVLSTANGTLYATGTRPSFFGLGYQGPPGCADNDILARSIIYFVRSPLLAKHVYPLIQLANNCDDRQSLEKALMQAEKIKYPESPPGEIMATDNLPGSNSDVYTADVRMDTSGLLLFKMNFHPGWVATVDGKRVATEMVVPAFLGVVLDKGQHHVSLEYEVLPLKRVLEWVSLAGFLLALGFLGIREIRRTRLAT